MHNLILRCTLGELRSVEIIDSLFKEAKKDFPELDSKWVSVWFYRVGNKRVIGIEFRTEITHAKVPKVYKHLLKHREVIF